MKWLTSWLPVGGDEGTRSHSARASSASMVAIVLAAAAAVVWFICWDWVFSAGAPYGDDNSAHMALMMHIADLWEAGETDLWWHQSNLGLPLFLAYHPLPAIVSGTGAWLVGLLGADGVASQIIFYKATIVGLWSLMPVAWYVGSRWIGLSRPQALVAGLASLAVHDVFSVGFGWTAAVYGGLYTQNWGMLLFPLTVGAFKRWVVDERGSMVVPVGLFVLASMSHLFVGMYAGIATLTLLAIEPSEWRRRVPRGLTVWGVAIVSMTWWLVPLLMYNDLAGGLPWKNTYYNGWAPWQMARHIAGGQVFDAGRFPGFTLAAGAGVVAAWRHRNRLWVRWLAALLGVTLLLWMGRTTWGEWYGLIPMHGQVNVMRYINGVHACGIWAVGIAGGELWEIIARSLRDRVDSRVARRWAAFILPVIVVGSFLVWRGVTMQQTLQTYDHDHPNVEALIQQLRDDPPENRRHRMVADSHLNTTAHFFRDLIPRLAGRGQLQSYAHGYHATLSTYYAEYIGWNENWFRLFNVADLVAREPFDRNRVDGFERTFDQGPFEVHRVPGAEDWGYFDFVRTPLAVEGGYHEIRRAIRPLAPRLFRRGRLASVTGPTEASRSAGSPIVSIEGGPSDEFSSRSVREWVDLAAPNPENARPTSTVVEESVGLTSYEAQVRVDDGRDRLLLKANYAPYWHATVDGESVPVDHVTPNFMAIDVPTGEHEVKFDYRNPLYQKAGAVGMILVFAVWGAIAARRSRFSSNQNRGGGGE